VELDGNRPCIRLRAETTKSRRADELPIHPDLVTALADSKPRFAAPTDRVFKTVPTLRTFKLDLARAKMPVSDERGRTLDRHALRTTFVSWLGLHGVDPRAQIALARHSSTGVTLRHYQDFWVFDLWTEIAKLPGPRPPKADEEKIRATGTDCDIRPGVRPLNVPL